MLYDFYTIEYIKKTNIVSESITSSEGEERILGSFNIHIGGVTLFADKIIASKRKKLAFVDLYHNNTIIAMYIYDIETKELI